MSSTFEVSAIVKSEASYKKTAQLKRLDNQEMVVLGTKTIV